jgi:hypothetical protein
VNVTILQITNSFKTSSAVAFITRCQAAAAVSLIIALMIR